MPAKTPIYLKAANNKKGKKFKLRDILSPDMISPPLGDFRHTIHIGKEGQHDVFGDISFLQGNYELLPGNQEKAHMGQFPGHNEFFRANSTSDSMFTETPSPVLKNAISLPTIGGSQALMLPLLSPVTFNSKQESFGPGKLPRLSCEPVVEEKAPEKSSLLENGTVHQGDVSWGSSGSASQSSQGRDSHSSSLSEQYADWAAEDMFDHAAPCELLKEKTKSEESLSDLTGSLLSLQLDLGPSFLDEVLNVMDKNK
ncbi:cdc42 effector protein 3 [Sus scrofa]|uniref:CDC42 effector protein 3 n=2 Tax=Sus scrofa TaxID=9823 RepID=A0A4X1T096_PIG|nr:cdc42 effector protein 3 [Sus scrofa]XP_003481288.1 cdc42 effector protein 3 [Sus scrofa]XP_003481289.1 cdc42 effector protein 3 [Sus scrofa]XP_005662677.1 cdc42 effector protein 3 [Sus scrofa]XP_005662678.1 cdc42 effector protein 3 [Sus scrofa]XP_005662679.1 cdc42 effector protein 3 [Sus scrofa]